MTVHSGKRRHHLRVLSRRHRHVLRLEAMSSAPEPSTLVVVSLAGFAVREKPLYLVCPSPIRFVRSHLQQLPNFRPHCEVFLKQWARLVRLLPVLPIFPVDTRQPSLIRLTKERKAHPSGSQSSHGL
jgi:hypothetical protein